MVAPRRARHGNAGVIDLGWLRDLAHQAAWWQVLGAAFGAFAALYFSLAGLTLLLTHRVLPALGIGRIIDPRPLRRGQIRAEIGASALSIAIFALYGLLTLVAERHGWVRLRWTDTLGAFALDMVVLTLWNEVHFYLCHRLLHRPWWYRHVHLHHHRSVVPTPFSTYSFHWVEAAFLSSVMILLLLVRELGALTVLAFPVLSLAINNLGHMNYAVFPGKPVTALLAACRRHTLHHGRVTGNFAFFLPWPDAWLGTRVRGVDAGAALPALPPAPSAPSAPEGAT